MQRPGEDELTRRWTIGRATAVGLTAGLLALLLWPLYAAWHDRILWPFAAALAVAALCGTWILLALAVDLIVHRRGARVRAIRAFDLAVGLLLAGPALLQLNAMFE